MVTQRSSVELEAALAECADPVTARGNLERLWEAALRARTRLPPPDQLALLVPLLACASPGARLVAAPRAAVWLTQTQWLEDEKPALVFEQELAARVQASGTSDDLDRALRRYRNREMARIALRDLTRRAPLRVVVREVSHLADALVGAAVSWWDRALARKFGCALDQRFCVVAMGKHGAEELNYSSDIDVLFVLEDDGPAASGGQIRDQAITLARSVIRTLSSPTAHGFCFRVDSNLRPYGRDGPLAQTLEEMERYYERAGQTWERAALIKARPCAGGLALGQTLLERLRPFVYRRTIDMAAVESLAAMKQRIDREQAQSARDNVKLGRGGIREIEFFVQALQLLQGGRNPALRVRSTLGALEALLYAGLVSSQDHAVLSEAYVFLRDTEHRLQLPNDRQTQVLPDADEVSARLALARRMGFTQVGPFEDTLASHRSAVHERFVGLLAVAANERPPRPETERCLGRQVPDEVRTAALASLGFQDPESALSEIRRLQKQPEGAFGPRTQEKHPGLAERLLEEMSRSPDPDLALRQFGGLFLPQLQPAAVTDLLASSPATARLLIMLFGSSETLTRDLQLHPELLDSLMRSDAAAARRTRTDLDALVAERMGSRTEAEECLAVLRVFRRDETLRIGLFDLAGQLDAADVGQQLTDLAETILSSVYGLARAEISSRYGEPAAAQFAVLAQGSFGGAELDYESDLDLVFVYEATGTTSGGARGSIESNEWAVRVSQRLLSYLTTPSPAGLLYRVDARLRPSGSSGPLVTSFDAFARYHGAADQPSPRGGALWERQALLRARPIAGDPELGEAVTRRVLDAIARQPPPEDATALIADMRYRLDSPGKGGAIHLKKGPGGLLDVEFLTQCLEIRNGLRVPSTRRAIDALIVTGALDEALGTEIRRHYEFLRRVESRLRLLYWRPDVFVPAEGPGLKRLARQLGDAGADGGTRLRRDVQRTMLRLREIFRAQMA